MPTRRNLITGVPAVFFASQALGATPAKPDIESTLSDFKKALEAKYGCGWRHCESDNFVLFERETA